MADRVAIVTDSVACLPQELIENYQIEVVPIQLIIEDKTYQDGVDITAAEFYKIFPRVKEPPTSAGALPGAFIKAFQKVSRQADNVFCVTISAKLSGMFESARQAREILKESLPEITIELFDSGTAAAAQGLIVPAAARAAMKGASINEVRTEAQKVAAQVYMVGMLDTLKYLSRSGRVPRAAALAGQMLRIKPIFALKNGEAFSLTNSRSYESGIRHMLETLGQTTQKGRPLHVIIMHADSLERAVHIKNLINQKFENLAELFITEFTPVMGAYTGPGVMAMAFYSGF